MINDDFTIYSFVKTAVLCLLIVLVVCLYTYLYAWLYILCLSGYVILGK